jgi:Dolichyl-phosphate-mannose-protein mannosyltransferase
MKKWGFPGLWLAALFILLGLPFLRQTGLHYDASAELGSFYSCCAPAFKVAMFGREIPLMVIPYLGAFKAWLYQPILRYLELTPLILRLPMLVVGAFSVLMFFQLLKRVSGRGAAVAGTLLLVTDATFVIATGYDFGPIALLHFFLLAGILLMLRFHDTGSSVYLALAFFLFGLALWHKALFIWMLAGLVVATCAVFHKRVLALFTIRRFLIACLAFGIGALPLVYYNAATGGATFKIAGVISGEAPFSQKLLVLRRTMDGSILFGFLTDDSPSGIEIQPARIAGRISLGVNRAVGTLDRNWMFFAFLAACLTLPWLWFTPARAPAMFAAVFLTVTWGQMLVLPNTGAALHHAILLWPFPHFLIAVSGARIAQRLGRTGAWALLGILTTLVTINIILLNEYYAHLLMHGTRALWTDAVYPLSSYLEGLPGSNIVTIDWGYATTLCLLSDGEIRMTDISFSLLQGSPGNSDMVRSLMADPGSAFVAHVHGEEIFPGVRQRLSTIATEAGYTPQILSVIADRNHRPRFEVFRYVHTTPLRNPR